MGGLVAEYNSPAYATAVGLVLYGSEIMALDSGGRPGPKKGKDGIGSKFKGWMKEFF
jgi:cell division ATPase FtsA